jgi:hypothetical protein
MPHINRNRRTSAAAATLLHLLAALLLTACGGSSKSSSSTAAASATTTTNGAAGAKGAGANGARFTALRECLQKNGVTLAKRTPGQGGAPGAGGGGGGGGFRGGAGPQLPKGVTQSQFQAALKKCGGASFGRGGKGPGGARQPQRLAQFSACMAKNGVKLPAPNTSGKGPIFNTKGVNTSSAAFKAAYSKCMSELRPAGGGGPGAAGGTPGAGPGAAPEAPAG